MEWLDETWGAELAAAPVAEEDEEAIMFTNKEPVVDIGATEDELDGSFDRGTALLTST
jgi:hypothetical protein